MAYIHYNKELEKYRLFDDFPVMCKLCALDYLHLHDAFIDEKTEYENDTFKVIKTTLERVEEKIKFS